MATSQNPAANVDLFDLYFQRADLDRDGRISGAEAVGFFQGSGLQTPVLAQIWAFANPRQADFLGRAEFYNALKLVTVAQSNRQLTPDIVKAALYSPAAAKIPAPKINILATPQTLPNSAPAGAPRPPIPTPASVPQPMQSIPALNVTAMPTPVAASRPPLPTPAAASQTMPTQGFPRGVASGPRPPVPNTSSEWAAGSTVGVHTGTSLQVQNDGSASSMGFDGFGVPKSGSTTSLPTSGMKLLGTQAKDGNSSNVSGNGFASDPFFGGDMFAATPVQTKQDAASGNAFTTVRSLPPSPAIVPNTSGALPPVRANTLDSVQRSVMTQIPVGQLQPTQSVVRPSILSASSTASTSTPGVAPATGPSQVPWPKMTQTDAQKYMKVFVEVDTDKDGKISGEQARNLFLSWRLPREVLMQVWDLSDQDNDSMLSFREFCVALYLMERYREGRPIPVAIPSNVIFDVSSFVQPTSNAGNAAWRPSGGFQQQQVIPGRGGRQVMPQAGQRPPLPRPAALQADEEVKASQPKSRVPELEKHLIDQLSTEEQDSLNLKFKEATDAAKKVEELEKEILESRQKIEFFGTKMQELVLYKSRCDNRLNEIMERSSADKREVESLAKKYEEKYKQSGDVASKLTIEESTFRDIQEKKMELYRAILKMEQDGGADGVLQGRAIQIQSDLDELVKALNERCKKYGLRGKPLTLTELPFGWQPGIQEGAADWDEDWDKFEDEGFTFVKELTLDVKNVIAPPKEKSVLPQEKEPSAVESPRVSSNGDHRLDKPEVVDERVVENGSHSKSEDLVKSAPNSPIAPNSPMGSNSPMGPNSPIGTNSPMGPNSPIGTNSPIGASSYLGSPSGEFSYSNFEKTFGYDASPRFSETQSGSSSLFSGNKSFVEPSWGAYDNNDDLDSVWGFNASSSTIKDTDHERNSDNYFFGSEDFGLNPIKTGTSQSSSFSQNTHSFNFDDSVPSTPLYNIGNSPPGYKDNSGPSFDSFSRFDSFRSNDGGFLPKDDFARFDSMRSSRDFDQTHGFLPLDDSSDPFGSSGPFRPTFDSQTPRKSSESWNAF